MTTTTRSFTRHLIARSLLPGVCAAAVLAAMPAAAQSEPPIVRPGAPGEASRELNAEEATDLAGLTYSEADVRFMQDMIPHHNQAIEMAVLVEDRTERSELIDLAERIEKSQKDEIDFMQGWLEARGEDVPDPDSYDAMHVTHKMAGMASPEEMDRLAASEGEAFDKLFLELMIDHHKGAVDMVDELLDQAGSASDPVMFEFVTDIDNDQTAEIKRMGSMLAGYSTDPRVGLEAGFRDAGEAILNLELVAALPKPRGFFDPENPAGLPKKALEADAEETDDEEADDETEEEVADDAADAEDGEESEDGEEAEERDEDEERERPPFLSFSNTDMAFAEDFMVVGNYHGFNIYDITNDGMPELISSVVCPGGQGDVSIAGDLLFMSVEQTRGRLDCGLEGVAGKVSEERFRGVRIFDIGDLRRPEQVGAVQTCRGSHTHSVIAGPNEDGNIIVYNSGTSSVRDEEELAGCSDAPAASGDKTAMFRIDVIEVPVDNPGAARIVDSPAVFADPETGALAGLWEGGDHGPGTQRTRRTDQCHDITAFPELNIAAGACSGNGVIFDISDPLKPTRIDEVTDSSFAYWHSATFNNDGTKVLFTDEWGGGGRPRCQASDPMTWGADAIYTIENRELEFGSYYKIPAPQSEQENCVAHNGSIIPVPGRDIFVQAWYQGGLSIIDFTDAAKPVEIAYFDRGPIHEDEMVLGGYWSTYWYDGLIYGTAIVRGLDVFRLTPSEHMSENEIAAAKLATGDEVFNPQQQFRLDWPAEPVVALAYRDQLVRAGGIDAERAARLTELMERADDALANGGDVALARDIGAFSTAIAAAADDAGDIARRRLAALGETLDEIAARLR